MNATLLPYVAEGLRENRQLEKLCMCAMAVDGLWDALVEHVTCNSNLRFLMYVAMCLLPCSCVDDMQDLKVKTTGRMFGK